MSIIDELRNHADQKHNSACLLSKFDCTCSYDKRTVALMQEAAMRMENALAEIDYALKLLLPPEQVVEYVRNARYAILRMR